MKKIFLLILPLFFFSCDNNDDVEVSEVTGQWLLVATLQDPGDGSGIFMPVNDKKTIQFKSDGTLLDYNGIFCQGGASPLTYDDQIKMINVSCSQNTSSHAYQIENGALIINYPQCYEACALKFRKFED